MIISGILKSQINDIKSHFGKFNLKLVKSIYINKWASIIFKKYEKQFNKLKKLLNITEDKGADYYLLSTADEFLNEYVPEYNMRLKWLTNFSGSNGIALISRKRRFFFTDGRYILQAHKELEKIFEIVDLSQISITNFIGKNLKKKKILIDTKNFSKAFILDLINVSKKSDVLINHDKKNSIDLIWTDKPLKKSNPIFFLRKNFLDVPVK